MTADISIYKALRLRLGGAGLWVQLVRGYLGVFRSTDLGFPAINLLLGIHQIGWWDRHLDLLTINQMNTSMFKRKLGPIQSPDSA